MVSINNINSGQPLATANNTTNANSSAAVVSSPKPQPQDAVSLSQHSKDISELQQKMASETPFDSSKVNAIKEAITNGSYTVDPEKLADSIIRFESDFKQLSV